MFYIKMSYIYLCHTEKVIEFLLINTYDLFFLSFSSGVQHLTHIR